MTTGAPFADIETMLTETTMSMLGNVIVTPAVGDPFPAQFDPDTTDFFDTARGADYTLRYATAAATLARGDTVTISGSPLLPAGTALKVAEKPRPLQSGHEHIAPLARILPVGAEGQGG